jgi:hypothetical protein
MRDQWAQFLSHDNFVLALRRLQTAPRTLYKSLHSADLRHFSFFEAENVRLLIHSLAEGHYEPQHSDRIFIPKKKNLVRPLTVLQFIDLLVYQAVANVVADVVHPRFVPFWNSTVYGNIFRRSDEDSAIFFYYKWQPQWKKYNRDTSRFHHQGYYYFADFDFASYFDTIDHEILCQILSDYGIEDRLLALLKKCLKTWTRVNNRGNYGCNHGIPQGPISSSFFADLYLMPLDLELTTRSKLEIKYFRYMDDIRVLAKREIDGQKALLLIDLLARDFGLVPHSEKVNIRLETDIGRRLNKVDNKFSRITSLHHTRGSLPGKEHAQLRKHLLNALNPQSDDYLDKTVLSFSLFKLNKDDEIRESLLRNIDALHIHFEGLAYYFGTFYPADRDFEAWVASKLLGDSTLFQHLIALIFKNCPTLGFDSHIFEKHYRNNDQFWLTRYYVLDWLDRNEMHDLIRSLEPDANFFVNRKLSFLQYGLINEENAKRFHAEKFLNCDAELLALQFMYLRTQDTLYFGVPSITTGPSLNPYVRNIVANEKDDYLNHVLKTSFGVADSEQFFNDKVWKDAVIYDALKTEFSHFVRKRNSDPSGSLMALDLFNEIVCRQICDLLGTPVALDAAYGGFIDRLAAALPHTYACFKHIHVTRNERTDAHFKDSKGIPRLRIKYSEYERLLKWPSLETALWEICNYHFSQRWPLSP